MIGRLRKRGDNKHVRIKKQKIKKNQKTRYRTAFHPALSYRLGMAVFAAAVAIVSYETLKRVVRLRRRLGII